MRGRRRNGRCAWGRRRAGRDTPRSARRWRSAHGSCGPSGGRRRRVAWSASSGRGGWTGRRVARHGVRHTSGWRRQRGRRRWRRRASWIGVASRTDTPVHAEATVPTAHPSREWHSSRPAGPAPPLDPQEASSSRHASNAARRGLRCITHAPRRGDRARGARERQRCEEVQPHLGLVPCEQLSEVAPRAFGCQPALALGFGRLRLQRALKQFRGAALGVAARQHVGDVAQLPLALRLRREQHGQRQRHGLRHHQSSQQQAHDLPRERRAWPAARGTLGVHGPMLARTGGDVTPARLDLCVPIFFSPTCHRACARAKGTHAQTFEHPSLRSGCCNRISPHCSSFQCLRGFGRRRCPAYDLLPDPP